MKSRIVVFALVALFALAIPVLAGDAAAAKEINLEGKLACAKCVLKAADAKDCQTVLVVGDKQYYIVKNDVAEKSGHNCEGEKAAAVSGTVQEKDGKMWLTATKMTASQKA